MRKDRGQRVILGSISHIFARVGWIVLIFPIWLLARLLFLGYWMFQPLMA